MNKDLLKIRKVKSEDARQWHILVNKVWRYAYGHIFPEEVFIERENKLEERVKDFDNKIYNDNKNIAYVAEYDGKIIGIMCGSINSSYEYFNSEYADLIGLYIDPKFHGCGIGRCFCEDCCNDRVPRHRKTHSDKYVELSFFDKRTNSEHTKDGTEYSFQ